MGGLVRCRAMFTNCLSDVSLIPPCDRVVLEMEFAELCKWAVDKLRSCLLEIDQVCAGPQPDVDSIQQQLHKVSEHSLPVMTASAWPSLSSCC